MRMNGNTQKITNPFRSFIKVIKEKTVRTIVVKNQRNTPALTESTCSEYLDIVDQVCFRGTEQNKLNLDYKVLGVQIFEYENRKCMGKKDPWFVSSP